MSFMRIGSKRIILNGISQIHPLFLHNLSDMNKFDIENIHKVITESQKNKIQVLYKVRP
jgi:hypothetical protein